MIAPIVIDVLGTPAPKGSGRAMLIGGKARYIASGSQSNESAQKAWTKAIRQAASGIVSPTGPVFTKVPLAVGIVFRLARPRGHYGKGRNAGKLKPSAPAAPIVYPDADKLARTTLDALTGLVFDDDARIVELGTVKTYATPGREGARIIVKRWSPRA